MPESGLITLLQDLVRIPSVNPYHGGGATAYCGEQNIAAFAGQYLETLGFSVTSLEVEPGRPNMLAVLQPSEIRRTILFEAHLDTVGVDNMTIQPFGAEIVDDRMTGRGSCDTKGPMAAALWALNSPIRDELLAAGCRIIFLGAMGEECGNVGASAFARDYDGTIDDAIILEPTDLKIVHAHKGVYWLRIIIHGRSAHGSNPEKGLNAIDAMTDVIAFLKKQTQEHANKEAAGMGAPTINIGRIEGGQAMNVVAPSCLLEVDRRTVSGDEASTVRHELEQFLEGMKTDQRITGWQLEEIERRDPFATPHSGDLVTRLKRSCSRAGLPAELDTAAWYSDAGMLALLANETVVFGPGSILQAHTPDEFIPLRALQDGSNILKRFLDLTLEELQG